MDELSNFLSSENDGVLSQWGDDSSSEQLRQHEDDMGLLSTEQASSSDWFRAHAGLFLNSAPEIELPREPTVIPAPRERQQGRPPPGCSPDAIKLFVGNIPKSYTETQLLPLFQSIGQVVDLVVVRDKATRESKGSAFVWYQNRAQAELAMSKLNMRYILPDPSGKQTRPLALRKAQQGQTGPTTASPAAKASRRPGPAGALSQSWASPFPPVNGTGGLDSFGFEPILPQASDLRMDGMHASAAIMNSLAQALGRANTSGPQDAPGVAAAAAAAAAAHAGLLEGRDRADIGQHSTPQLYPSVQRGALNGFLSVVPPAPSPMQLDAQRANALNIAISRDQLMVISDFAHRMHGMSGAKLNISPADTVGVFNLCLTGNQLQVDTARMLLCRVLGLTA